MSYALLPFVMVPQQHIMLIERFGKYVRPLQPGINLKVPFVELVAYHHSLKEQVLDVDSQTAITKDNVKVKIDGVLYYKITDAIKASYEVAQPLQALSLLAQTSMRSEIGKLDLDRTFEERESLNANIKSALNEASSKWGINCMRYEIKDIKPPDQIKRSMELQAESERIKRSKILNSEGERDAQINEALGQKQASILQGQGKAQQYLQEARGIVESLQNISQALGDDGRGMDALRFRLSESYMQALNLILRSTKVLMIPQGSNSSGNTLNSQNVATALTLYKSIMGPAH